MTARILVVDDVPANLKLFEAKLTAEYYEVLTAADGQRALEIAGRGRVDLILLDVMMPGLDGFAVCERLRADPATRHLPIVMLTALSDVADRVRGLEAGADDFLSKPVSDLALMARVRSLLRLKTLMDELQARRETLGQLQEEWEEVQDGPGRLLIVDDRPHQAERLASLVREEGHQAELLADPKRALHYCRSAGELDLVIVSSDIGGLDGLRLSSQIRSQEETRHLPVLLLLELPDLPRQAKALDIGVNDYLFLPIDRNELKARVRTQIRRRRYHRRLISLLDQNLALSYRDPLTGAYNRRYLEAHLARRAAASELAQHRLSLMLIDVDYFKAVNDAHGHAAGDEVLRELVLRINGAVRVVDLLARYGGEEFILVMPDTALAEAQEVADRLRRAVAGRPFTVSSAEKPLKITVSAGVAEQAYPGERPQDLIARADRALYAAKRLGRNRVLPEDSVQNLRRVGGSG